MGYSLQHIRPVVWACIVTLALATAIAVVTLLPVPSGGVPGSDKTHHALSFACLAVPLTLVRPRWAVWVILGATAFGGVIEVIQPTFGRAAEWADLWADGIGSLAGAGIGVSVSRLLRLKRA